MIDHMKVCEVISYNSLPMFDVVLGGRLKLNQTQNKIEEFGVMFFITIFNNRRSRYCFSFLSTTIIIGDFLHLLCISHHKHFLLRAYFSAPVSNKACNGIILILSLEVLFICFTTTVAIVELHNLVFSSLFVYILISEFNLYF